LTWLIVRINDFGWIGMAVIAVVAISLAIINRKRILKEAHEMEQKA